jgi:hypothetical protein
MVLEYNVNQSAEIVIDYLSDIKKFASIHPIIYKTIVLPDKSVHCFEKLPLGPIYFPANYIVKIEVDESHQNVTMTALVMKLIHVHIHFQIVANGASCRVIETVNFRSIFPVNFIMKPIFKKQHRIMFENLNKLVH